MTLRSPFHVVWPASPPYDADQYRLPIGTTVFWITVGLVVLVLAIWLRIGA